MGFAMARVVGVAVLLGSLATGVAYAQPKQAGPTDAPSREQKAEAGKVGRKGQAALRAKRFEEAEDALRRADEIAPSPQLKLDRARALIGLQRDIEARGILRELAEDTTPAGKRVATAAKSTLATVEKNLAKL